jgi:outer membrane protein OmpA-like peptidoglycan-associated protein
MVRSAYSVGILVCLLLGLADLGVLNLKLVPQVVPPDTELSALLPKLLPGESPEQRPTKVEPEPEPKESGVPVPVARVEPTEAPAQRPQLPSAPPIVEQAAPTPEPASRVDLPRERPEPRTVAGLGVPPDRKMAVSVAGDQVMLHFATNQHELTPAHLPLIERMVASLSADAELRIQVHGHTDRRGDGLYNEALSLRRANSVATRLRESGIAESRIEVKGFGATQPLDARGGRIAYAKNRRAELKLQKETP